jgi:hypothetical protein
VQGRGKESSRLITPSIPDRPAFRRCQAIRQRIAEYLNGHKAPGGSIICTQKSCFKRSMAEYRENL